MLEFGLKHYHSSEWHKKFPRRKIEILDSKHLGMRKHLRLKNQEFCGRRGYLSNSEICMFLEKNLGKNVDDVFSEFIKRAKRFDHDVNLKKEFYDELDPNSRWPGDYEIDSENRIIKRKKKKEKRITATEAYTYNETHYPSNIKSLFNDTELVYLGEFYILTHYKWRLAPVWMCNKEWYNLVCEEGVGKKRIKYESLYKVSINMLKHAAVGIPKKGFSIVLEKTGKVHHYPLGDYEEVKNVQYPYCRIDSEADYIFLSNIKEGWHYRR